MTMRDELNKLIERYRNPPSDAFREADVQLGYVYGRQCAADEIEEILNKYPELVDEQHLDS